MAYNSEQVLDSLPMGVIVTDLKGTIVEVNATLAAMIGYDAGSLTGKTLAEISAERDHESDQSALTAIAGGSWPDAYIKALIGKDGNEVPVEAHSSLVDGGGNAVFVIKSLGQEMELLADLQRRNMQMLASSEVSRAATQIHDASELISQCVDLIRTHFGFYYAAIFLIDEAGEWANLEGATGEAGKNLLAENHRLGVGSQSMVGWVTANNAARIALDVGDEAIRFDNPHLPKTRSEMALPLRVRNQVIGALDTQSTSVNAFSEEDIQTIQMMADQVAIAIENARLFSKSNGS